MRLRTRKAKGTITVGDIEVEVEQLTPSFVKNLRKRHTEYSVKAGQAVQTFDDIAFALDVFKAQVRGWKDVTTGDLPLDEDGNKVECSETAKEIIYENDQQFVKEVAKKSTEFFERREEDISGNS